MRVVSFVVAAAAGLLLTLVGCESSPSSAEAAREALVVTTDSGAHRFQVEIADDERSRELGLMFRREMPKDAGMLFDFHDEEPVSFWMRNTYIPLDMLFIKADGTIDSIAARATPLSERSIPSKSPVRFVLEINGGLSATLHIVPGDKVSGPAIASRQ
jgi:uncharacterized membrane protein (UPF0127 family)